MTRWIVPFLCLLPAPLGAHPHVFVDTGLEVIFDEQNRLTHVRVTWVYDDFYSLLIAEDYRVDSDGDGAFTAEEEAQMAGFDARWVPGYNGDLVVRLDGRPLVMSGPLEPTARMENGRIVSTHLREISGTPLVGADELSLKAYDETYYTAYELSRPVTITGASGCAMERIEPNIDGELAAMQAQLLRLDPNADLEENDIPLIGGEFATEIRISCAGT